MLLVTFWDFLLSLFVIGGVQINRIFVRINRILLGINRLVIFNVFFGACFDFVDVISWDF